MFDLITFIKVAGYLGVGGVVFVESALLVGFFLPGDSLLFTAGFLASQGFLSIWILVAVTFVAAVVGDSVGYSIGRKAGEKLFVREKSFFFNPRQVERAHAFFEKHGAKTVILARFLPVVRTLVPMIAGIGRMDYRVFLFNNIIGGALWAIGVPFVGFLLGHMIPGIDTYLVPIIIGIIFVSLLPTIIHLLKDKEERAALLEMVRRRKQRGIIKEGENTAQQKTP